MAISIFIWTLTASACLYLLVVAVISFGWFNLKQNGRETVIELETSVSLVIALRNEEVNVGRLLQDIYNQNYPQDLVEIILVDDHSEDLTRKVIGRFRKDNKVRNIVLAKSPGKGKKTAINEGIKLASGQLIVTTDGDCRLPEKWLSKLVEFYNETDARLVFGPVIYHEEKGLLQRFFSLDFASLVASGAGSAGAGLPLMGNGANLAFGRKDFLTIESEMQGKGFASGDDVFLIHQMARKFGSEKIRFLKDREAIVRTAAPRNLYQFLKQRTRWASKAKVYRTPWSVAVPLVIGLFNLLIAVCFLLGFYQTWFFVIFALYVLLKFVIDLPLLFGFLSFSEKNMLKWLVLPLEIIYPFYIVVAATLSLFVKYEWKGRENLK